jgi:hypothetical protein
VGFPVSIAVIAVNSVFICNDEPESDDEGSKYCQNIGKINRAMTDDALKASRKGGAKVRRFVLKIFTLGRHGKPKPGPAPVEGSLP